MKSYCSQPVTERWQSLHQRPASLRLRRGSTSERLPSENRCGSVSRRIARGSECTQHTVNLCRPTWPPHICSSTFTTTSLEEIYPSRRAVGVGRPEALTCLLCAVTWPGGKLIGSVSALRVYIVEPMCSGSPPAEAINKTIQTKQCRFPSKMGIMML